MWSSELKQISVLVNNSKIILKLDFINKAHNSLKTHIKLANVCACLK